MSATSRFGAANEIGERERVAVVEREWPMHIGRAHLPPFWNDADARRFLIAQHGFLTIDAARAALAAEIGEDRVPSRSAVGRFWQSLDAFWRAR